MRAREGRGAGSPGGYTILFEVCSTITTALCEPPDSLCLFFAASFTLPISLPCLEVHVPEASTTDRTMDFLNKMTDQAKDVVEVRVRVLCFLPRSRDSENRNHSRKCLSFGANEPQPGWNFGIYRVHATLTTATQVRHPLQVVMAKVLPAPVAPGVPPCQKRRPQLDRVYTL